MWRLVIRVSTLVLVFYFLVLAFLPIGLERFFAPYIEQTLLKETTPHFFLFQQFVEKGGPPEEWQERFDTYRRISPQEIRIEPLSAFPAARPDQLERLHRGDLVPILYSRPFDLNVDFYYRIGTDDRMMHLIDSKDNEWHTISLTVSIVVFLAITVALALWSYRLWSDLKQLSQTADRISKGDYAARANPGCMSSIAPIVSSLNRMAERTQRMIVGQRELVHSVSHELRTPISRLEFGLELLRQQVEENDVLVARINDLNGDVAELHTLVDELLQLARLAHHDTPTHPRPFDIADLVRHSLRVLENGETAKTLICSVPDTPTPCYGDPRLIERALTNLLRNAQKYAAERIAVTLSTDPDDGSTMTIDDDGPGISADARTRIFEPFYRLERSWDKQTTGYGLGLAIAQRVAVIHNGSIAVDTSPMGGARFILHLPPCKAGREKDEPKKIGSESK